MIDPHVHLRDWNQRDKETMAHGMRAASCIGIDALFEMPNTDPALTTRLLIEKRIVDAQKVIETMEESITYGLYAGLTADSKQRSEVLQAYRDLFPKVIGYKLFAGHSTGHMGMTTYDQQLAVYRQFTDEGYRGILAVHCEKESLLHPELWDPANPISHSAARPVIAEVASVADQIRAASETGFLGILHICHVSSPETIRYIEQIRRTKRIPCIITCGVTPHHVLLSVEDVVDTGNLVKMNPPLRDQGSQRELYKMLLEGRIDWIESDHAPHTLKDKEAGASGIPGFGGYGRLVRSLIDDGISEDKLAQLTGERFK